MKEEIKSIFENNNILKKYILLLNMEYKTGDILLYHGKKSFIDNFIEFGSRSKYSHVSMIIVIPNPAFKNTTLENGVYVIESGKNNFPDEEDGIYKFGVQMKKLENVLQEENQEIWYRKLECDRNKLFYDRLKIIHDQIYNIPYDTNILDWENAGIFSWFHCLLPCYKEERSDKFWCSSLVAYILINLELIPSDTPWKYIAPKHLGSEKNAKVLNFINCKIHNEIILKK